MSSTGSPRTSDEDLMALVWLAFLALAGAGTAAAVMWRRTLAWSLDHQLLVPSARHPLLRLPHSAGAGLDLPRLMILAAAVLAAAAVAATAVGRRVRAGEPR